MEPKIIEKPQMLLVGFSFFGDPFTMSAEWTEENEIGRVWNRFKSYMTRHHHRLQHIVNDQAGYEVHIEHEETAQKGHYEIFVGQEVERFEDVPVELLMKTLPVATYAVFTLKGRQIISDWSGMIGQWMSQSGYERFSTYGFQLYDHRFKGIDKIEESEIDAYVPVKVIER